MTDGTKSESFEITFESEGRHGWRLALGLGLGAYYYSDKASAANRFRQLPIQGVLGAGYLFKPGHWELNFDARGTLLAFMLTDTQAKAANWYSLGYHLGYQLPVGEGEHTFGLYLGWYHYFMTVPDNAYGLPRQGFTNLSGPQLLFNMRYRPLGRLGWSAYVKLAPLSDTLESLSFGKLDRRDLTLGFTHDLAWFGDLPRRPAVLVELGFVALSVNRVDLNESHGTVALMYPLH
ncbi:MAG: hypothetical protein HY075_06970 [Deltaproteobacteria bacterium]|nr:hypothetical protein [Deltaproteobacteria bacterium]